MSTSQTFVPPAARRRIHSGPASSRRPFIWLALLAVFALLAASCGSDDDDAAASDDAAANDDAEFEPDTPTGSPDDGNNPDVTNEVLVDPPRELDDTPFEQKDGNEITPDDTPTGDACTRAELSTSTSTTVVVAGTVGDTEYANNYKYDLFVPSGYTGEATPLVVNFHGLGSNGPQQSAYTAYPVLAEEENFIVVHPTGLTSAQGLNSWELPQFDELGRDDVAFTRALLEDVKKWVCVDTDRIYSTGMSNGGFFSAVVACELSDVFAATFSVAGMTHAPGCVPAQPIAMGLIHGTADAVVAYSGGGSTLLSQLEEGTEEYAVAEAFFLQSMPDEIAEFAADFGCNESTESAVSADLLLRRFGGCDDENVEVVFYTVQEGQHVWPGAPGSESSTTTDFDATRDGWAFLSQFTLTSRSS